MCLSHRVFTGSVRDGGEGGKSLGAFRGEEGTDDNIVQELYLARADYETG
jgi:hypothetical protein